MWLAAQLRWKRISGCSPCAEAHVHSATCAVQPWPTHPGRLTPSCLSSSAGDPSCSGVPALRSWQRELCAPHLWLQLLHPVASWGDTLAGPPTQLPALPRCSRPYAAGPAAWSGCMLDRHSAALTPTGALLHPSTLPCVHCPQIFLGMRAMQPLLAPATSLSRPCPNCLLPHERL